MTTEERLARVAEAQDTVDRYLTLKSMDCLMEHMNDLGGMMAWRDELGAGEPLEDDVLAAIAGNTEEYKESVILFFDLMHTYARSGLCVAGGLYDAGQAGGGNAQ